MSNFKIQSMGRKNRKGLALPTMPSKTPEPSAGDAQLPGALGNNGSMDTLEIGVEFQLDLKTDEFVLLKELGHGNGGTVSKVMHPATKIIMARKIIHVEAKEAVRKNIVRELHIMKDCSSPNIVTFYGAFLSDTGDVIMCMEYMDAGSLDRISKDFGPVRVDVLGKISVAVLGGLIYLYDTHRIMHRDIKPSNVLVNSRGQIKLCDFGVSGELVNSVADTFVGTSTYMAPERIQGAKYTIKSDVWSFGLTVMELAIGRFPFDSSEAQGGREVGMGGILDLLQQIVHEPPPRLPKSSAFPPILDEMIQSCLTNKADDRPTPKMLFENDLFIQAAKRTPVDLEAWAVEMMQKNNRKSHLAAPLSPATQALLKSEGPFAGGRNNSQDTNNNINNNNTKTPTSGEIPIAASAGTSAAAQNHNGQPTPVPPVTIQRVMSSDAAVNADQNKKENSEASTGERPGYPPRTSSTGMMSGGKPVEKELSPLPPTLMPIRPAPGAGSSSAATSPVPPHSAGRGSRRTPGMPEEAQPF